MKGIGTRNRLLAWAAVAGLGLFTAFAVATTVSPLRPLGDGRWFTPAYDFALRMTELDCLRRGVNPYDVWHGDVVMAPYVPNWGEPRTAVLGRAGFDEDINAYVPWEYTAMLPLSFLPRRVAWAVYYVFMLGCLGVVVWAGVRGADEGRALPILALLAVAYPVWSNLGVGNFAVVVLAALALMAVCLDRGRDDLAGLCWAVAMVKPQLGLPFAIPLLMGRRWRTCFVAAGVCLALSVPPALMCRTSPLALILQAPAASAFAFTGCGTLPHALVRLLPPNAAILVALAVGAVVCAGLTRLVPDGSGWFLRLTPAAVCATAWTYTSTYGHALGWFLFLALAAALVRAPRSRFLWGLTALALVSTTRLYGIYRAATTLLGPRFPALYVPEEMNLHLESLNSTLDLFLCAAFVLWLSRRRATPAVRPAGPPDGVALTKAG